MNGIGEKARLTMSIKDLPQRSGVYLFLNSLGKVIYVGKANRLKARVSSYFRETSELSPMKQIMVREIKSIRYIEARSGNEALVLESHLIKKFSPPYNVVFKDDKDYLYIRVGIKEKWPTIKTIRRPKEDGNIYLGPYPSAFAVYTTLKFLRKVFPFLVKPKEKMTDTERQILEKRAGRAVPKKFADYRAMIAEIAQFLQKKDEEIITGLREKMMKAVREENFEQASQIRDQILALENIWQKLKLRLPSIPKVQKFNWPLEELMRVLDLPSLPYRIEGYDISNIQGQLAAGSMVVLEDGFPARKWYRKFKIRIESSPNDVAMMGEVLDRRFSHLGEKKWPAPDLVVLDGGKGQLGSVVKVWKKYKLKIPLIALAKQEETIYFPEKNKKPLNLPPVSDALHILQVLRDEAHRFSRAYHFLRRSKKLIEGQKSDL